MRGNDSFAELFIAIGCRFCDTFGSLNKIKRDTPQDHPCHVDISPETVEYLFLFVEECLVIAVPGAKSCRDALPVAGIDVLGQFVFGKPGGCQYFLGM